MKARTNIHSKDVNDNGNYLEYKHKAYNSILNCKRYNANNT